MSVNFRSGYGVITVKPNKTLSNTCVFEKKVVLLQVLKLWFNFYQIKH